jgi:long-subunit acyl-CoA synthetase (AMP-forming)
MTFLDAVGLAQLTALRAQATPHKVGFRYFNLGLWETTTWSQFHDEVQRSAHGLRSLGVVSGSAVYVVADNEPATVALVVAACSLGADLVISSHNSSVAAVAALLTQGCAVAVVGDEEQYDKILETGIVVPIVTLDTRGLRHLLHTERDDIDTRMTLPQMWQRVDQPVVAIPVSDRESELRFDGETFSELTAIARAQQLGALLGAGPTDVLHAQQPLSQPMEFVSMVTLPLVTGAEVTFGGLDQVAVLLREMRSVRPTLVHSSARWLGAVQADIANKRSDLTALRSLAMKTGWKPTAPRTQPAQPRFPVTRMFGLLSVVAVLMMLVIGQSIRPSIKLLLVVLIVAAIGLVMIVSGQSVVDPLRRRYGVNRLRAAYFSDESVPQTSSEVLGALQVPLVDARAIAKVTSS